MSVRNTLRIALVLAIYSCGHATCTAQRVAERGGDAAADHIETDRDSFTRSPRVVEQGRPVVESSYTFLDQKGANDGHLYPDLLVRYATTDWLELRAGWTYEAGKSLELGLGDLVAEEEGIATYGAKIALTSADGWIPDSALIGTGYTPTSGESNDTDFSLEYAAGWELPSRWEVDAGLRWYALAEKEDHFTEWAPSLVLKTRLYFNKLDFHVEGFSLLSVDHEDNYQKYYVGPGGHYLITPNVEIGVRVFWGLGDDSSNFICNAGMGVRF